MKKLFIVGMCLIFLAVTGIASAEYVFHSGKRGTGDQSSGKVGDSTHVWKEGWFNELHFPKRIAVPLTSVYVVGTGPILTSTTPACTAADNVPVILYDTSAETTAVQFPWAPSSGYVSGMQLEVVISSSVADGTTQYIDWAVFVQDDSTAFGTTTAQTGATGVQAAADVSNDVLTLTLNATAEALITAGESVVTISLWSSGLTGSLGTTEIKNITILEP